MKKPFNNNEMERWLAAIVESSDDAIISKDLNGIITSWNKGAAEIFGYTSEEVIGKPATILMPPERVNEEPDILKRIRRGQRIDHYETVRRRKDGSLIDVSLSVSPVTNERGEIIGASKIARDITARRRTEEALRESNQLFRALVNTVPSIIWSAAPDGTIIWSSAQWYEYTGQTPENGNDWARLVLHPDDRERCLAEWAKALESGTEYAIEVRNRRHDGEYRWFLTRAIPVQDESNNIVGWFGATTDIHDRKMAEAEREKLLEREQEARQGAETANRLKDEFLATLSHELRNPLNVILGYAEVLLRNKETRQSEFVSRAAQVIRKNAQAQSQLICDLLDLSRLHMGKLSVNLEPVSLSGIIENAVETVRNEAAAKRIALTVDIPDEVLFLQADPLRLEQVVWNLLNNAVKFTPAEGVITISLCAEQEQAVLAIKDTGEGIDPIFLPHVFEMFRQADASSRRTHSGLGIGLALVAQLVKLQGGSVEVHSAGKGQGATFTIRLPLSAEETVTAASAQHGAPQPLDQLQVLVVDDSEDTVEMLKQLLQMHGAAVSTAKRAAEALQLVSERPFDLILSDISMPTMDGYELLRALRSTPGTAHIPAIALTGFGRDEDTEQALGAGFSAHVTKPLDTKELIQVILAAVKNGEARSSRAPTSSTIDWLPPVVS